jgi:hypothetical protein
MVGLVEHGQVELGEVDDVDVELAVRPGAAGEPFRDVVDVELDPRPWRRPQWCDRR